MSDTTTSLPGKKFNWLYDLLFVGILLAGACLRFTGSDWGEMQHQHPDESFFTSVVYDIAPIGASTDLLGPPPTVETTPWRANYPQAFPDCVSWGGYFDTACSPLNPENRGKAFYVYGNLPLFIVRGLADLSCQPSLAERGISCQLNDLKLFGRWMAALSDLLTVALLYIIAARLYNRRVALLAAAFSAFAVMQIQQSHFFTADSFTTPFMFVAILFAVEILVGKGRVLAGAREAGEQPVGASGAAAFLAGLLRDRVFWLTIAFGLAYGMALASKLTAVPLAILLPVVILARFAREAREEHHGPDSTGWSKIAGYLVLGAVVSLISFRIFQPYAFSGLFGINPNWLASIREVRAQASPNADLPWALQWARRTHLYSFENLTVWGLGLPLGILAWAGFLWMAWRMFKGEWQRHLPLWLWTALYFGWQSMQYNPTMRYQLPIYPLLALMAAWFVFELARSKVRWFERFNVGAALAVVVGGAVLILTAAWAFAFSRIYVRPETRVAASEWIYQNIPGPITLRIQAPDGPVYQQPLPFYAGTQVQADMPYQTSFTARNDGLLTGVLLPHVADYTASGPQTLYLSVATAPEPLPEQVIAAASVTADFAVASDPRGEAVTFTFDPPAALEEGGFYYLRIEAGGGALVLSGASFANETDYDYPLPFRTAQYDAFGGIYRGDLNLQVYWDDNADKLARFQSVLDQADYIFIPTNHQYGQITRLPERYPLTTAYYRHLLGCPEEADIIRCYRVARPGDYRGDLGFELVAVFESYPSIGPIVINDQAAEEAFTFYDHPKVMIFKKGADYDPNRVAAILESVDLNNVVRLNPGQADQYKTLLLTPGQAALQQAGGTWSELFDRGALHNRYPALGLLLWYLFIFFVGLLAYPLVRAALPGLADRGYPLARLAGLLLWAWFAWIAGSLGLTYSRTTIAAALGLLALLGMWQAWRQRDELAQEFSRGWRYFLLVEAVFLSFFLLDLFIRLGNPDLWHPAKGGERPMNFSYFNAILKSTVFPPYDPWFAGGYINYYYYGYVIVGTPVKLLGIVPSLAYNFILPTLFACLALGGFSVAWNLLTHGREPADGDPPSTSRRLPLVGGLSAAAAMVLLGNLGVVRMFYQGFQRMAAPGGTIEASNLFQRIGWTVKGFFLSLGGLNLPYGPGDWYWNPSRALPDASGSPITEFPLFTFLYSDLHAHMIALPLTVLAVAWALSVLFSRGKWNSRSDVFLGLFLGGLTIGVLKPTNTWDFYTYLVLGAVVLFYAVVRYAEVEHFLPDLPAGLKRFLLAVGAAGALVGLSLLLYQPFSHWFGQAYSSLELWKGERSNISSYLIHWGVFLFFIVSWMAWETRQWLAATPISALHKLRPFRDLILAAIVLILLALIAQQVWVMSPRQYGPFMGITILWLAVPLAVWAALLLFRPGMSDGKRLVLFMTGTGLLLTMVVELLVLRGDIGRMNTVFKFYLQVWVMLGLGAAAALGWLLGELRAWLPGWRVGWSAAAVLLAAGAALFLLAGGSGKIRDRMNPDAPHTLDSMDYMAYAHYYDYGVDLDLSEDYRAIRWMQENVQGSPVIVEANCPEYRWCTRYTIYTGLPGVAGWNWHQRQQRALMPHWVEGRVAEITAFYTTADVDSARTFLETYDVRYFVVGQLERAYYLPGAPGGPAWVDAPNGLLKFDAYEGIFWNEVYRDGQTVIYEVSP